MRKVEVLNQCGDHYFHGWTAVCGKTMAIIEGPHGGVFYEEPCYIKFLDSGYQVYDKEKF